MVTENRVPGCLRSLEGVPMKYYNQTEMLQENNNHESNHYLAMLGFSSTLGFKGLQLFMRSQIYSQV